MLFGIKKFIAISSLMLGAAGVYFGYQSFKEETDLPEVLEYVQDHPEHNEEIINHSIRCKIEEEVPYSISTLRNLSEVVLSQAIQMQSNSTSSRKANQNNLENNCKHSSSYRPSGLTPEEKWNLLKDGLSYGSEKAVDDVKNLSSDFCKKLGETKVYERFGGEE